MAVLAEQPPLDRFRPLVVVEGIPLPLRAEMAVLAAEVATGTW